jgi:hypothetical protein
MYRFVILTVALLLASNGYAEARGGSGSIRISTHTGSSHARTSTPHTGSTRTSHTDEKPAAFKHATCKSPSCFQKHPTGEYMIPIYAKK